MGLWLSATDRLGKLESIERRSNALLVWDLFTARKRIKRITPALSSIPKKWLLN